jgi:hypothetical protein
VGQISAIDIANMKTSDTARAYAHKQFADDPTHELVLAKALTLLELSDSAPQVAAKLEQRNVKIEIAPIFGDMGGQYVSPFSGGNVLESFDDLLHGKPLPHLIKVAASQADDPRVLAAMLAHEGSHFELTLQPEKNLPIRIGSGIMGGIATLLSLPTLGMIDFTGTPQAPGVGTIATLLESSILTSAMTHENYAYRAGDKFLREMGWTGDSWVLDTNGAELGAVEGGWNIAKNYMQVAGETVSGKDIAEPKPWQLLLEPALGVGAGLAAWWGAVNVLHIPKRWAGYAIMAPGAIAAVIAGVNLVRGGGQLLSRTEPTDTRVRIDGAIRMYSRPMPVWDDAQGKYVQLNLVDDTHMADVVGSPAESRPIGVPRSV